VWLSLYALPCLEFLNPHLLLFSRLCIQFNFSIGGCDSKTVWKIGRQNFLLASYAQKYLFRLYHLKNLMLLTDIELASVPIDLYITNLIQINYVVTLGFLPEPALHDFCCHLEGASIVGGAMVTLQGFVPVLEVRLIHGLVDAVYDLRDASGHILCNFVKHSLNFQIIIITYELTKKSLGLSFLLLLHTQEFTLINQAIHMRKVKV